MGKYILSRLEHIKFGKSIFRLTEQNVWDVFLVANCSKCEYQSPRRGTANSGQVAMWGKILSSILHWFEMCLLRYVDLEGVIPDSNSPWSKFSGCIPDSMILVYNRIWNEHGKILAGAIPIISLMMKGRWLRLTSQWWIYLVARKHVTTCLLCPPLWSL